MSTPEPRQPTAADIEKAYPHWRLWVGIDQQCHALRTEGAALTANGEDWLDLRDQIERAEAMLEATPQAWRRPPGHLDTGAGGPGVPGKAAG
jgi:hypothetical protein